MEYTTERFVIWDKPNDCARMDYKDALIVFTRKGDARARIRRDVMQHNRDFRYSQEGYVRPDYVAPYREVTEEDFEIVPCTVTFTINRT